MNTQRFDAGGDPVWIDPHALARAWPKAGLFDEDCPPEKPYDQVGPVAVICIDGPLTQRGGWWWDGYESIRKRYAAALADASVSALVLRINSPGGVTAGLFEAVRAMRAEATQAGKRVIAYADETAYSAAYGLACVADEIVIPETGGVGSVGVISTPMSYARMQTEAGIDVAILASGEQKADLHPCAPLAPEALARQQARVNELASIFAGWVGERRRMPPDAVLGLQAGVAYGRDAIAKGLADRVSSLAEVIASATPTPAPEPPKNNVLGPAFGRAPAATPAASAVRKGERTMEGLTKLLGLSETATEAEAIAKVAALQNDHVAFCTLTGAQTGAGAVATAQGWKARASQADAIEKRLEEDRIAREKAEHAGLVNELISSGRFTPAQRGFLEKAALADLQDAMKLPPVVTTAPSVPQHAARTGVSPDQLTDGQRAVARQLGITPAKYAEQMQRSDERRTQGAG